MKIKLKKRVVLLLLAIAIGLSGFMASAQSGALDLSFGKMGKVQTGFGGGFANGKAVAAQTDGKVILAGLANNNYTSAGGAFALARLSTNNLLDSTFGSGGEVVTPLGSQSSTYLGAAANTVKVQADGKIVAAGFAYMGTAYPDFTVVRYNSDGSLDANFGTNGVVSVDLGQTAQISAMAIQGDGKIVVCGYLAETDGNLDGMAMARFLTNGVLDATFGTGGTITMPNSKIDALYAMLIQGDGKIVAVGSGINPAGGENGIDFAVLRFATNGVLDTSFGGGTGQVFTRIATSASSYLDYATAIGYELGNNTILNPDKLVVGGYYWDFGADRIVFALARYLLDGTLDTSFGTGGVVTTPITSGSGLGGDYISALVVQNGIFPHPTKIIAAGYTYAAGSESVSLARYTAGGALDTSFNGTGTMNFSLGSNNYDEADAMIVQSGNYLIVGSSSVSEYNSVFATARITSAGVLDTNFGGSGIITEDISDRHGQANAVAVQPDDKVVAVGYGNNSQQNFFAVARYQADGELDPTFGPGGKFITPVGSNDQANAVFIQPDGKIVVGGSSYGSFALVRYATNGVPDSTFGTGGIAKALVGNSGEIKALQLQPDGKIVAAGDATDPNTTSTDFAVARFNPNGTLDTSFGSGGKVLTSFQSPSFNGANAVELQPDGKCVLAGFNEYVINASSLGENFALTRYNTNGAVDFNFGSLGRVSTNLASGTLDTGYAMAIQPNGKIIVAGGAAFGANSYVALARFNTNGVLDTTFGNAGVVIAEVGASSDYATSLALQPDGKMIVSGASQNGSYQYFAQRYETDGSLDPSFGNAGTTLIDFGTGTNEIAYALALDPQGRAVIAGAAGDTFGIVRLAGNPALTMTIRLISPTVVRVSWPATATGWNLQQKNDLAATTWSPPAETVINDGTNNFILVTPASGCRFYRLASQ